MLGFSHQCVIHYNKLLLLGKFYTHTLTLTAVMEEMKIILMPVFSTCKL